MENRFKVLTATQHLIKLTIFLTANRIIGNISHNVPIRSSIVL